MVFIYGSGQILTLMNLFVIRYNERRESETQMIEGDTENKSYLPIQLRFLIPSDIIEVKQLCEDSFPIDYPISWQVFIVKHNTFL